MKRIGRMTLLAGVGVSALMLATAAQAQAPAAPPAPPPITVPNYTPVTADDLLNPPDSDWLMYRRTYNGWGYSPLNGITADNVANLEPVWSLSTGQTTGHEAPPQVRDGVMFAATAGNQVLAIDAVKGDILWRYLRPVPEDMLTSHPTNRGLGLLGDKVYFISRDNILVALDAKSGAVVWETTFADYKFGYYSNLAPLVVDGKVIVGSSGGERGIRGYVAAFDAENGEELWRTFTIPAPGEPGSETWPAPGSQFADAWKTGGGSTWVTGIYNPDTNNLYWGVGNGGPWMGDRRPGDNLYVTSVISMDLDTGAIEGHYQYHPNDSWDWDEVNAPLLIDLPRNGQTVTGLVHAARNGVLYFMEAKADGTIEYISHTDFVYTDWYDSVSPEGKFHVRPGAQPGTGVSGTFCPSFAGGVDWPALAYSPDTNYLYIPANENLCGEIVGGTVIEYVPGANFTTGSQGNLNRSFLREGADHVGEVQAWDMATGQRAWTHEYETSQNWGPMLATGGNLVFTGGTNDRKFHAFNATTGDLLWEMKLNSGIIGVPSTWSVDGKQYVSIEAGWGIDAAGMQNRLANLLPSVYTPSVRQPVGGVIWTFAVP